MAREHPAPADAPVARAGMPDAMPDGRPDQVPGNSTFPQPLPQASPIEALYRDQWARLVRYAYLLTRDLAEAEDAVQDAFVALQRRPALTQDPDGARAYLHVVLLNRTRRAHRTAGREARLRERLAPHTPASAPPANAASSGAVRGVAGDHPDLVARVNRLPRRQREVVALRYWAGLTEREIAAALGVSPGTVKSAASRALATLSRTIGTDPVGGGRHDR